MAFNVSGAISRRGYLQKFPTANFQINFKSKTKSRLLKLVATSGIANDKHESPRRGLSFESVSELEPADWNLFGNWPVEIQPCIQANSAACQSTIHAEHCCFPTAQPPPPPNNFPAHLDPAELGGRRRSAISPPLPITAPPSPHAAPPAPPRSPATTPPARPARSATPPAGSATA